MASNCTEQRVVCLCELHSGTTIFQVSSGNDYLQHSRLISIHIKAHAVPSAVASVRAAKLARSHLHALTSHYKALGRRDLQTDDREKKVAADEILATVQPTC